MRRTTLAGAVWVGLSIICLGPLPASDPPEPVNGQVVDQNGQAVSGAVVEIDGKQGTTKKSGAFVIAGLEDGSYTARIQAGDSSGSVKVSVAKGKLSPSALRITLKPQLESAKGKVLDRDGAGVAGATVQFGRNNSVSTNSDGYFVFEGEPGTYQVKVTVGGKTVGSFSVTLRNGKLSPSDLEVQ